PESLFILLTSDSGRAMLSTVTTVIVDEIHAVIGNKRGSHLALSMERLAALTKSPPVRIGLSATQKPIDAVARYLVGNRADTCTILDSGYRRESDLDLIVPDTALTAVMSMDGWQQIYDRLATLIEGHRTTLIFVNTRRLAERAARFLAERIGEDNVTAHHGSLAKEHRLRAEQRLKNGELRALVATASLELGIDIGDIDLVCQLGSPRSISTLLQRIGRSGHRIGALPRGRLFPLTRDDLVECTALLYSVKQGRLDTLSIPVGHLDVLAQHIIAEVACGEWQETGLFDLITGAWNFRDLEKDRYAQLIRMLVDGYSTRRGQRGRYLFRDAVNKILKPRKGAKLIAVTNAGAIPDQFDYDVILEPDGLFVGTLNEDFAFESLAGDIFQLGNTSYRILQVSQGKVRVADANGQPPNIPFWFGEAPGRSDELSTAVSDLRSILQEKLSVSRDTCLGWVMKNILNDPHAAGQLTDYLVISRAALGTLPTRERIILERFFDDNGDQHLVVHSPYGARVNRAWGLALRKRFCRQFNFELQAAALDDYIVLSLGATHSFDLEEIRHYLKSTTVREVLIQAMLAAPMFATHWRWNATIALAIQRFRNGSKTPPPFQRADAEDLMAVVFPDQLACQENITGEREVPDHPLVKQTVHDCLHDIMDIETLEQILHNIEAGEIEIICRDLAGPSPMAEEILHARPYAFLDDAPAEERRTRAVSPVSILDTLQAGQLGQLDHDAIRRVKEQSWPNMDSVDEFHDALYQLGFVKPADIASEKQAAGSQHLHKLIEQRRAGRFLINDQEYWVCAERSAQFRMAYPGLAALDDIAVPGDHGPGFADQDAALLDLLRSRLACLPMLQEREIQSDLQVEHGQLQQLLAALEQEGFLMRVTASDPVAWCERGLLARIHRYGLSALRQQIKAVSASRYMQFLLQWHGLGQDRGMGEAALARTLEMLEGFSCPAGAWETDIIPSRIKNYFGQDLDRQCSNGQFIWLRLATRKQSSGTDTGVRSKAGIIKHTPLAILPRNNERYWKSLLAPDSTDIPLSSTARQVHTLLMQLGATFFIDLVQESGLLRTQTEDALAELAACGLVTSDSFAGLRALVTPASKRPAYRGRRRRNVQTPGFDAAGRWTIISATGSPENTNSWLKTDEAALEHIAWVLLQRYGVVFYQVLERESVIPPWRELLYLYRRLEARGEIRGGRFVEGFSGEQFALPEAVGLLNGKPPESRLLKISACDPLNLLGIILPGDRIPATARQHIILEDGIPVAQLSGREIHFLKETDPEAEWRIRQFIAADQPAHRSTQSGKNYLQ
ncbi:MAG: hypothetical protein MI673_04440, partial [Thiotrichales bacterium]|nr:hypothetical protein [Thiotrichales bacterium]